MSKKHSPESWAACRRIIDMLPDGAWWDTFRYKGSPHVGIQSPTHVHAETIFALFPGVVWTLEWDPVVRWWSYHGTAEGVIVEIYGITNMPPPEIEEGEKINES